MEPRRLWPLLFGYDFFVSHRRADAAAFAESLVKALQARGFVCFLDREETVGGVALAPAIERALKRSRALIAILTPGVPESPWVITEITSLFADLVSGSVFAVVAPLTTRRQPVLRVSLVDAQGQPTSLNALAGGRRSDPRFFNFPDGSAGVLLEATGTFYRLTELSDGR